MTGTVHRRYLLGVCSDPHMIFCACSMQNGPHEYAVDHTSFYVISKLFTQTFLIGRGDVTFLHIAYVKSTKNVGKPTCVFGRFKNPFFLWLIQILKTVTMIMVTAIAFFWSFMRNPAIQSTCFLTPRPFQNLICKFSPSAVVHAHFSTPRPFQNILLVFARPF